MSDVTTAVEQDAIADSLLGDQPEAGTAQQQPVTETQETQQEVQPDVEQAQEQVEEQSEDWLPTDQEKVYPDEVLSRYAQRYGFDEGRLSDPLFKQLVIDKINADVYIRQIQEQAQQQFEPEPEPVQQQVQPQPTLTPDQHFAQLQQYAQQNTSPEAALWFHNSFMKSLGVPDAEIAKMPRDQAIQFGQMATAGIANVINTIMPTFLQAQLQPLIEQAFPQCGEMYERSSNAMAWDQVRNSDPRYADLPAYGTKEFSKAMRQAAARIPGFDDLLPERPNFNEAKRFYSMLAHFAKGGSVDTQLLQQAAATGATNARRAAVRRSAANLGSGQSKAAGGQRPASQFQTNQDIFDDDTMKMWNREHGRL